MNDFFLSPRDVPDFQKSIMEIMSGLSDVDLCLVASLCEKAYISGFYTGKAD